MKTTLALVALFVVAFSVGVCADGMIIPEPMPPHPHPDMLEVKYHHVDVSIDNQFTDTSIDQKFHNPNSWDIEGTYLFPLPDGASIQKFSMFVNGEELEGEILDAGEARRIYEDLVRKMIDPGLLEYVDRNTFKARVYPIEANSDKRVTLEYSEVISCENGICEYTYPLDTERFSSKNLDDVVINVKIKSNVAIKSVYSPSHEIDIKRVSDNEVDVSYEASDVKPDTDFKLIYTVSEDDIGVNLLTHKEGSTGYFMLMLAPKFADSREVINKDIVFVLDKSGSMAGEKIEQAKDALKFCLNNLNSGDHFGIVTFSTGVSSYKDELEAVNMGGVDEAVDFVDEIKALGGTDIESALLEALDMLSSDDHPKTIVFLTDGEPTVGVTDITSIIEDVTEQNEGAKLFVFGIGYDVNTFLLDKLAMDNHGAAEYVVEDENIEVKVSNFYEKIDNPLLSNVELGITGVDAGEMYPKTVPDIFKGTQILVLGQYTRSGMGEISIGGNINGVENTLRYSREFPSEESGNDFLPRLWATRKVGYLLEQIRLEGEEDELIDEVIALAKKYGIATPYTSFLILEDEPNWANTRQALAPMTGESAVSASQDIGSYKAAGSSGAAEQEITGPGGESTTIKYVGSKTFIEKDGVLTDTGYVEGSATKNLKYGSEAYFETIAVNPVLGQYFAIGKNVIVCEGVCIKVGEDYSGVEEIPTKMEVGWEAIPEAGCQSDSDCTLDCGCMCEGLTGPHILCIRQADCPKEQGITGCKCVNGACAPVTDPNWEPTEPPVEPNTVCGNGVCEQGEGSLSCPADCALEPIPGTRPTTGQDNTSMMLLIMAIVVVVLAGLLVMRIQKRSKPKKTPKLPAGKPAAPKAKNKK